MLKKYICHIASLIWIISILSACAAPVDTHPTEASAQEPLPVSGTYYNDYLGLGITVPTGWQINTLSKNLSLQSGQTADPQLIAYAGGGGRMELLDIQNLAASGDPEHCRVAAYADIFPEPVEAEQYVNLMASLLQNDGAEYNYLVQKQEQAPLALHNAWRVCLEVEISGTEQTYMEEYYIVPLPTAFVVFYLNYWPQNDISHESAFSILEQIILPLRD